MTARSSAIAQPFLVHLLPHLFDDLGHDALDLIWIQVFV
jgi:hypothetical protein